MHVWFDASVATITHGIGLRIILPNHRLDFDIICLGVGRRCRGLAPEEHAHVGREPAEDSARRLECVNVWLLRLRPFDALRLFSALASLLLLG